MQKGAGARFAREVVCVCVCHPSVSDSLPPHGLSAIRPLCPWNSPGKNTGVGCHCLFQEIFPTQGSNLSLLHCREILYHLSQQGGGETLILFQGMGEAAAFLKNPGLFTFIHYWHQLHAKVSLYDWGIEPSLLFCHFISSCILHEILLSKNPTTIPLKNSQTSLAWTIL